MNLMSTDSLISHSFSSPTFFLQVSMVAIGVGSVADGTSGNANGNGQGGGVAINGGHTHQGCTDAIGSMCFNPP